MKTKKHAMSKFPKHFSLPLTIPKRPDLEEKEIQRHSLLKAAVINTNTNRI